MLQVIQSSLYEQALCFREEHSSEVATYDELRETVPQGFVVAYWCGSEDCETKIKEDTKATIRCIPLQEDGEPGHCVCCDREAPEKAIFARAF